MLSLSITALVACIKCNFVIIVLSSRLKNSCKVMGHPFKLPRLPKSDAFELGW